MEVSDFPERHFGDDPDRVREAALRAVDQHLPLLRSASDGRRLSAAMLPLFRLRPPAGFGVLTTVGAKTGQPRPKCVRAIRTGATAYLVALRPPAVAIADPQATSAWVWNMRATPAVELRLRDGSYRGTGREISEPAEIERAYAALCGTLNRFDLAECAVHLRGRPSRAKAQALHRYWFETGILIAIDLAATGLD